jgi:enoyl-CoA hydratase/carnithine racemase
MTRTMLLSLLTMAAASALTLPPDCGVATWRAGPSLVRVELDRGGKLNALTRSMWEALDAVLEDTDDALLITSGDAKAFSAGADVNAVASEPVDERRDFLRLEYETLEKLQERQAPTVAVADGLAFGAGAGVFMACGERIVTERSRLAMPECRIGIVPDAGALRFLTKHCEPAVARYLALTGVPLNAHDLYKTGLATRYVPDKEDLGLDQLYAELSSAPAGELATPLDRRGVDAPRRLESGLFNEATLQAVRDAFEEGTTVDAVRADLETAREAAKKLQGSCGWATREAADGVLDVLDAAAARYGRRVELAANARLGGAPDFAEGVACVVGARRGERPKWSNDASLVGAIQRAVDGLGDETSLGDVVLGARG